MHDPSRVRVSGPLEVFAAGFAAELVRLGYRRIAGDFPVAVDGAREPLAAGRGARRGRADERGRRAVLGRAAGGGLHGTT